MTDQDDKSIGEIARSVARLEVEFGRHRDESRTRFHELASTMNNAIAPVGIHAVQIENQQRAIIRLDDEVKAISTSSARVSGGIAVAIGIGTVVVNWLLGRHA